MTVGNYLSGTFVFDTIRGNTQIAIVTAYRFVLVKMIITFAVVCLWKESVKNEMAAVSNSTVTVRSIESDRAITAENKYCYKISFRDIRSEMFFNFNVRSRFFRSVHGRLFVLSDRPVRAHKRRVRGNGKTKGVEHATRR